MGRAHVRLGVLVLGDAARPADGAEDAPVGDVHDASDLRVVHGLEVVQVVSVEQVPHFDHAVARAGDEPAARVVKPETRDLLAAVRIVERDRLGACRQVPRNHTRVVAASDHLCTQHVCARRTHISPRVYCSHLTVEAVQE